MMKMHQRCLLLLFFAMGFSSTCPSYSVAAEPKLYAGFSEENITPKLDGKSVFLAGFGHNRKATGVQDPLFARTIVLRSGKKKVALVSVDLVGLFIDSVKKVRKKLPEFDYILISSTHNHEGPDSMGLWGPHPFQSGVTPGYLPFVENQIVKSIISADKNSQEISKVNLGEIKAPDLLHDSRLPIVKHDDLVALSFATTKKDPAGLLVQWNCHPETLGSRNKKISADFVAGTIGYLKSKYKCPVVYFTGTVGGLMTSLRVPVKSAEGKPLKDGTLEKTMRYGHLVGQRVAAALRKGTPITLTPIAVRKASIFLPIDNKVYVLGWSLGVLKRHAYLWQGTSDKAIPVEKKKVTPKSRLCLKTELVHLRLGQLEIAGMPGEIYPELVIGKVQDPADPGADFPKAPIEPDIYSQMKSKYRMVIGLANDEIGYIIPKRQWDEKSPFCYGRKKSQYGEINSLGPETAPLICEAFKKLTSTK